MPMKFITYSFSGVVTFLLTWDYQAAAFRTDRSCFRCEETMPDRKYCYTGQRTLLWRHAVGLMSVHWSSWSCWCVAEHSTNSDKIVYSLRRSDLIQLLKDLMHVNREVDSVRKEVASVCWYNYVASAQDWTQMPWQLALVITSAVYSQKRIGRRTVSCATSQVTGARGNQWP